MKREKCKKCGKGQRLLSKNKECFYCNPDEWAKDNRSLKGGKHE